MAKATGLVVAGDPHEAHGLLYLCELISVNYEIYEFDEVYFIFFFKEGDFTFAKKFIQARNYSCTSIP